MMRRKVGAPTVNTESLIYSTIRITRSDGGSGTGFIFRDVNDEGTSIPLLITNHHVVEDCDWISINFHKAENGEVNGTISCTVQISEESYIRHPDDSIDLVAIPLVPILTALPSEAGVPYMTHIDSRMLMDEAESLDVVEDVIMVGYPNGLSDEINNHPLFRRGITSTHPHSDFRNEPVGVVDIAAFPGSSGSPIYMHRRVYWGAPNLQAGSRTDYLRLLGVLFAGPQADAEGSFDIVEVPTRQVGIGFTRVMMNLGYYVKAREVRRLLDFIYKPRGFVPANVQEGHASASAIETSGE